MTFCATTAPTCTSAKHLSCGLADIDPARGPRLQRGEAAQAALDGHGVALIGDMLVAEELAAGHLVRLFDTGR